jgi:hypothetical protein
MTKNLSHTHITSYAGSALLHEFISNRTNKKRKKDNTEELIEGIHKKKANQDNNNNNNNNKNNDKKYFLTSKNINNWYNSLNKVKKYIDIYKNKPTFRNKDKEIKKLANWIYLQQVNYKKKIYNMKDENIYSKWTQFINDYQEYFLNNEDNLYNWYNSLNKVKKYIDNNNKKPTYRNKDKEIQKLGRWISLQIANYKKKKEAMKDENIYSEWTQFMNDYQEYFLNTCDKWYNYLNKVKKYIDKNKKKPKESDKDKEIKKLRRWISIQQSNYKKKKETMKYENIYCEWTKFTNEYQQYFSNTCDICGKKDHKTINCFKFFFH